ncbi:helix-turn-helix domain-containing protein [Actinomadura sp. NPDC048394]|uniref:MarR family transcriptional regulator n=1 Tax=Actinomadura sp. NPDC048394 TaxID=3158223 RepID=UPI0034012FAA
MFQVIRIDDEVEAFLQAHRRYRGEPFNQVIRRLMNPDPDQSPSPTVPPEALLTRAQWAAFNALCTVEMRTVAQVAAAAGIGDSTAGKALTDLERKGLAIRHNVPGGASRRWHCEWRRTDPPPPPPEPGASRTAFREMF